MKVTSQYKCILSIALFFVKLLSSNGFSAAALTKSYFGKDLPHLSKVVQQDPSNLLVNDNYRSRLSTVVFSQPPRSGFSISVPDEAKFLVRTGTSWIVFCGIVTGLTQACHIAATHHWLWIGARTWDAISIALPSLVVSSCLFYLLLVFGSSDPRLILNKMGGKEIQDVRLLKELSVIYDRAGLTLDDEDSTRRQKLPRLFVVPSLEPNAFATGTIDNGAVAVTKGLLETLSHDEIRAVLAHEVGHIRNRDTVSSTQVAAMLAALGFIMECGGFLMDVTRGSPMISSNSDSENDDDDDGGIDLHTVGIVLYIAGAVTYCFGTLLRLFSSRTAEYDADAFAKSIGEGPNLASALAKIERFSQGTGGSIRSAREDDSALGAVNGAYAHAYIHNPPSRDSPLINLGGLIRTHPSTDQRIQKLLEE